MGERRAKEMQRKCVHLSSVLCSPRKRPNKGTKRHTSASVRVIDGGWWKKGPAFVASCLSVTAYDNPYDSSNKAISVSEEPAIHRTHYWIPESFCGSMNSAARQTDTQPGFRDPFAGCMKVAARQTDALSFWGDTPNGWELLCIPVAAQLPQGRAVAPSRGRALTPPLRLLGQFPISPSQPMAHARCLLRPVRHPVHHNARVPRPVC